MRRFLRSSFVLCGASVVSSAASGNVVSTWIGPANGNWNVAANWNNGVPGLGGVTDAVINAGRVPVTVTLNLSPTIASLTLGANCTLLQPNNADVTIAGLVNDGLWSLTSTGASTDILLSVDATFAGTGVVALGDLGANRILSVGGTRTLTNGAGHTIRGGGQIGLNNTLLVNHGSIEGWLPTPLVIDTLGPGYSSNDGLMWAHDGGTLTIYSTPLDNTGGTIRAAPGGTVLFRSSTIKGGTIETVGDGDAEGTYETTTFEDLTKIGTYRQPNNADSIVSGTIVNLGQWTLESTGAGTEMEIASPVVTFVGPGSIEMSDSLSNRIIGSSSDRLLVNSADHAIRGGGQLGLGSLVLLNHGIIEANQPAGLILDTSADPVSVNDGSIVATSGSILTINGTPLDNHTGVLRAEAGSAIVIKGSTITGGVLATVGDGHFLSSATYPTLVDLTLDGSWWQVDNSDAAVVGTINNLGTWRLEGGASTAEILLASDPVTFTGTGAIEMSDIATNRIESLGDTKRLVQAATHTIRGSGNLGAGNVVLENAGLVEANQPHTLLIDTVDTPASTNSGTFRASPGATLTLYRSTIDNTGGTIEGIGSGAILVQASTIAGGTISCEPAGAITFEKLNSTCTLDGVAIAGVVHQPNDSDIHLRHTITHSGTWTVESSGNDTDLLLEPADDGLVTIDGPGTIELSDNVHNRVLASGTPLAFEHGAGHTIRGAGKIGTGNYTIDNLGAIEADGANALVVTASNDSIGLRNAGTLRAKGVGGLSIPAGLLTNLGLIDVDAGSQLSRNGPLPQIDGETRVDGNLVLTNGSYSQIAGLLTGDGDVFAPVAIQGGSASPSGADGSDIGSLALHAGYTQSLDGGYVADLGLAGNDLLAVTGAAHLGGALQIRLVDPFVPVVGQEFTILTANSISGQWGCIEYPQGGSGYFHVVYGSQSVKLVVDLVPTPEADLNFNGTVGPEDLAILLGAWGDDPCSSAICCPADLDGDGKVNATDLAILLGDWG